MRYSVAATAPLRLSESTLGMLDEAALWSTATTGAPYVKSMLLGVTRIVPSVSVPLTRERYRRSQPTWSSPRPQPENTTRS